MRFATWAALTAVVTGCGGAATPQPVAGNASNAPSTPPATAPRLNEVKVIFLPEAVRAFDEERVTGAMALFDSRTGNLACSDGKRCDQGYAPGSTFEIAIAIIGLETGLLDDADSPLPWDGKDYSQWNAEWNHDHTLRSAEQVSCRPCFQNILRRGDEAHTRDWVTRFEYGNRDASGKPDSFWLDGALRISPLQQIDFMRRLDGGTLPLKERTLDVVRDVLTLDVGPEHVLRGKAGLVEEPSELGWFVGFVELGERRVFFATVIDGHGPEVDVTRVRRRVTERVLRELGDLP